MTDVKDSSGEKSTGLNYASNSLKKQMASAEEPVDRKMDKLEGVNVIQRKKPLGRKIADTFSATDIKAVGSFVVLDVIMPSVKDMLFDAIKEGAARAFYGETGGRSRGRGNGSPLSRPSGIGYTSYSRSSEDRTRTSNYTQARPQARSNEIEEIIVETRGDAQEVLDALENALEKYKVVSVSDLKDLFGTTGDFTDNNWGWSNLSGAGVTRVREGWRVDLPRPKEL